MTHENEDMSRVQELREQALPAEGDTEDMLVELNILTNLRRKDPHIEARYEELRDELVKRLKDEGPRYFVDEHGNKRFAWPTVPERFVADVSEAIRLYEEGAIDEDLLEEIAPRQINAEGLRRAARRGKSDLAKKPGLTPDQMLRIVRRKQRSTGYISFDNLEQSEEP